MALRDDLDARKNRPTSDAKSLGYHLRMWVTPSCARARPPT